MRIDSSPTISFTPNADFLRRLARRMLDDAHSADPSKALPVIRRVHAAGLTPVSRLTVLYHARATLQLKHMLRTLAAELGYPAWAACKRDVERVAPTALDRFRLDAGAFGDYHKLWFSSASEAAAWQRTNGGHLVKYGGQAVVLNR